MKTPIVDFVKVYAGRDVTRLHMPGHKGKEFLGIEKLDITEVNGADVLSNADGIIAESETEAAKLFGSYKTFYSTEGSSLCIKTMLALINSNKKDKRCRILAARNVHKSFVYGCALCDIDVIWISSNESEHLCSCKVTPTQLKEALSDVQGKVDAVYVTSPDYLGVLQDIKGLSAVCDEWNVPLVVDNAHGAYLSFLEENLHPLNLGASMCTDSAHKTLPVLTGGAYLHVSKKFDVDFNTVRGFMSLFGSTSPSYLILQSLDLCNRYLAEDYTERLKNTISYIKKLKLKLKNHGFLLYGDEELKLTVDCADFGLSGQEVAEFLRKNGIEIEFYDSRFAVMMFTPEISAKEIETFGDLMCSLQKAMPKPQIKTEKVEYTKATNIRNAVFSEQEMIPVNVAVGRVCATPTVSCPPAVPIIISGEVITQKAVEILKYYKFTTISVIK